MESIRIKLLSAEDGDRLFEFEMGNRGYFESIGLPRSERYYDYNAFREIFESLLVKQQKDLHYIYLIIDAFGEVVGRVNLMDIIREPLMKAELGYRMGECHQNKGYATTAIRLMIDEAKKVHSLHRLEAGTAPQNRGSQMVLIKNNFQFVGQYHQYIRQGKDWVDSLLFERILD